MSPSFLNLFRYFLFLMANKKLKKMKVLLTIVLALMVSVAPEFKIDFGENKGGQDWRVLSDSVMGGLSYGKVTMTENTLKFKGDVSLENNGGFSSIRSPWANMDLSKFRKVKMRFRSSGQAFAMTMERDQRWYMPYFKKEFTSDSEEWQEVTLDLTDFKEYRIGRMTGNTPSEESLSEIIRIGIVTNSKKASGFELELDWIVFE